MSNQIRKDVPDSSTVPVLTKAIGLLRLIAEGTDAGSLPKLAKAAGLATSSCYRIVNTLERAGWITTPGGSGIPGARYRLSTGLLPLLAPLRGLESWFDRIEPCLQRLADDLKLSAKLSVREGSVAVTARRAEPADELSVTHPVGSRFAVGLGATGAVLLALTDDAELERVIAASPDHVWQHQSPDDLRARVADGRRTGVCLDMSSYRPHIAGAAIRVPDAPVPLAVTVTGLRADLEALGEARLRGALQQAMRGLRATQPDEPRPLETGGVA